MFSSSDDDLPHSITILTLNCWGLKYLSEHRRERLAEIGRRLADSDYPPEIVGLQECWTQEDFYSIRRQTRHILPYSKYYFSGIFGGGLAILSKWPIEESSMVEYPLNGRPTAFFRGDWYVGKGVAHAKIRIGQGIRDVADVFCTHLHAPYEKEPHDSYLCHRTAQAWEIAKLMRGAAERGHLVIGLGDFNMVPLSHAHRLITTHAPVHDVWRCLHPESSIGSTVEPTEQARKRPTPSGDYNILENGATCDGIFNTWRWKKQDQRRLKRGNITVDGNRPDPHGRRLDYIFVGDGGPTYADSSTSSRSRVPRWHWAVRSARVCMMERHPRLHCSLSDHFAVEATIKRETASQESATPGEEEGVDFLPIQRHIESNNHLEQQQAGQRGQTPDTADDSPIATTTSANTGNAATTVPTGVVADEASDAQPPLMRPHKFAVKADIYDDILDMIASYGLRERFQRRARLGHFIASVFVSIGCLVGIWFVPRNFAAFILCLVSTLNFAAGVIDGLIGGLFISSELRALKEFEWEIRNARRIALGLGLDIEEDLGSSEDRKW